MHSATLEATKTTTARNVEGRSSPDLPPLPEGKATLLGGIIQNVDHIRDRMVLAVFGGSHTAVLFDERTRVFRNGKNASLDDLKNGDRAYVDTMLDGTAVFARNIRIADGSPAGQSSGQIVDFHPDSGELVVRDNLSPEAVKMHLAGNAVILRGDRTAQASALQRGTLVTLTFRPGKDEPIVQQVTILASPGSTFVFSGRVEHLDLHRGVLVLIDPRDDASYEVYFDPAIRRLTRNLRIGAYVTVQASFNGTHYEGRDIALNTGSAK